MPLLESFNKNSKKLLIACAGLGGRLNVSIDKFLQSACFSDQDSIIIYDPTKRATLGGLDPYFENFEQMVDYLQKIIAEGEYETVVTTGTSGGGHTALLLGHLLKAHYSVTFGPSPYFSKKKFKDLGDPGLLSMKRVLDQFEKLPDKIKLYFDLDEALSEWNGVTQYYVHVSRFHSVDYKRSLTLSGLPGFSLYFHPYSEHATAGKLMGDALFPQCFEFPYKNYGKHIYLLLMGKFVSKKIKQFGRSFMPIR